MAPTMEPTVASTVGPTPPTMTPAPSPLQPTPSIAPIAPTMGPTSPTMAPPAPPSSDDWVRGTWTTGYWDCCKPSCSWPGKGNTNRPVLACDADTGERLENAN